MERWKCSGNEYGRGSDGVGVHNAKVEITDDFRRVEEAGSGRVGGDGRRGFCVRGVCASGEGVMEGCGWLRFDNVVVEELSVESIGLGEKCWSY